MSQVIDRDHIKSFNYAPSTHYACRAVVYEAEEGGYFAIATNLRGACGQGDTIEDAIEDLKDSFVGLILSYDGVIPKPNRDEPNDIEYGKRVKRIDIVVKVDGQEAN